MVENLLSYIPNDFLVTLIYEYNKKTLDKKSFQSRFLENLRLWDHEKHLLEYLSKGTPMLEAMAKSKL